MPRLMCIAGVLLAAAVPAPDAAACKITYYPNVEYARSVERALPPEARTLFRDAQAAETRDLRQSIDLYVRAARAGDGRAALRLGEIYDRGEHRDFAASLRWYEQARRMGAMTTSGC